MISPSHDPLTMLINYYAVNVFSSVNSHDTTNNLKICHFSTDCILEPPVTKTLPLSTNAIDTLINQMLLLV
jgi:hypothetical protein